MGKIISFGSYKGGAGRTTTAVNVAYQLAIAGNKVVVVDLDVEGPGIGSILDIDDDHLDDHDLRVYFSEQSRSEQESAKKFILPKQFLDDDGKLLTSFDVLGASMRSAEKSLPTDEDGILHSYFKNLADELESLYDYVILDAASGLADLSILAYAHTHTAIVCFRWSKQHFRGAMRMVSLMSKILENEDYPLLDFVPVANAVAKPETEREKNIVGIAVKLVGENLNTRLLKYSQQFEYEVPDLQYVWECNDLKFDDRVVIETDHAIYREYQDLSLYVSGRLNREK